MKQLAGLFIVAFLWYGCHQKDTGSFSVQVDLQHLPLQDTAYLDQLQLAGTKTIDTARIEDASGKFTFTTVVPEEGLYRIRFADGKMLLLVLDGSDVTIHGDYTHLQEVKIKGSAASVQLNQFLHELNRKSVALTKLAVQYDSLKSGGTPDSLLIRQALELQNREKAFTAYVMKFADSTQSPACAVFALSLLQSQEELLAAKPVFENIQKRFPKSMLVKSLLDEYNNAIGAVAANSAINIGQIAPDISLPNPDGKILTLSNFRGKYVLLDFWASWCGPCRQENPNVVKAYNEFKNKNFTIFSVSLDSKKDSWKDAIKQDGLNWHQVSDLKGWDSAPADAYGIQAIPANFLLNPQGKVIAMDLRGPDLEKKLQEVLNKK